MGSEMCIRDRSKIQRGIGMIEALLWGLGLVLVIEGLVYALAPFLVESMLKQLEELPLSARRRFGGMTALLGAVILLVVSKYMT